MDKVDFTHEIITGTDESKAPIVSKSRIDFFLINKVALSKVIKTDILNIFNSYNLHHKAITLTIKSNIDQ